MKAVKGEVKNKNKKSQLLIINKVLQLFNQEKLANIWVLHYFA